MSAGRTTVLDPQRTQIRWDRHDGVKVTLPDGAKHYQVRLAQSFPVTRRRRFVFLYDREGNEIGILPDLRGLDADSEQTARRELDRSYFLSRIKRIVRVEERYGLATWHVITDRGPRSFAVRSRSENIWWIGPGRVLIRDPDGNRYEIRNVDKLDHHSRVLLDLHV
jgi:hypothetical protein